MKVSDDVAEARALFKRFYSSSTSLFPENPLDHAVNMIYEWADRRGFPEIVGEVLDIINPDTGEWRLDPYEPQEWC